MSNHIFNSTLIHRAPRIVLALLALLLISCVAIINKQSISSVFVMATTHQPERFTELYFVDSSLLPSYTPTAKPQRVTFRITNHEAHPVTYTYVVTQNARQLVKDTITLGDAQSSDINFVYSIPTPTTDAALSVSLIDRAEHIAFRTKS
jgi:uncharacterized membrane protein